MDKVPSVRVWKYVKQLGFGGAGYYHGELVHVDVGPARSWDEKTSGVGTDISENNKLIGLTTDFDIYRADDVVTLRFIRMTAFPTAAGLGYCPTAPSRKELKPRVVFEPVQGLCLGTS